MTTADLCRRFVAMLLRINSPAACDLCPVGDACRIGDCRSALLALVDDAETESAAPACRICGHKLIGEHEEEREECDLCWLICDDCGEDAEDCTCGDEDEDGSLP